MGKPIVMGRKTFDAIGKPLPGRTNIVITRDDTYRPPGARVFTDTSEALTVAEEIARADGQDEIMVIGGAQIYRSYLPRADRIYLTEIHRDVEGDAYFPELDAGEWTEVSREDHSESGEDFSFVVLDRVRRI